MCGCAGRDCLPQIGRGAGSWRGFDFCAQFVAKRLRKGQETRVVGSAEGSVGGTMFSNRGVE